MSEPLMVAVKRATCHPDRALKARGLCRPCYSAARERGLLHDFPLHAAEGRKRFEVRVSMFCQCRGPVETDGLGECSRCGRITREACERSLGIKAAA